MSKLKILDCTLRDGGYYNDWDFDHQKAKELIIALNESGVDLIEIGYKSSDQDSYGGLFKYCNESMLSYLRNYSNAEYAFMIDLKEFLLNDGSLDLVSLDGVVLSQSQSVFSWVRIASHYNTVDSVPVAIEYFKKKGYDICFNLMGGSLLSDDQIVNAINLVNANPPEVFYIADSFGSFYQEDIKRLIRLIKVNFNGQVGIHTHDNQGMAFANTLAAIEEGVDIVDGTVTGMGRGAGNLVLEQFLQKYADQTRDNKYQPNALLDIINGYISPLKDQYGWGFNYAYMLSGLKNIHPTYCQNLNEGNRYSIYQVSEILEKIPIENRSKYNKEILDRSIKAVLASHTSAIGEVALQENYHMTVDEVLIVAGGDSIQLATEALNLFIKNKKLVVIDCNNCAERLVSKQRIVTILNEVKLRHYLEQNRDAEQVVITGQSAVSSKQYSEYVFCQEAELGKFAFHDSRVVIPDYDAGLYAMAIAAKWNAKKIYLAGFDGFEDQGRNESIDQFLYGINDELVKNGREMISITPTKYNALKESSVYALL